MSIRQLIDGALQRFTKRRTTMETKNVSRQRQASPGAVTPVYGACGACGGEIVEINTSSHRRACFKCGKEPQ